MLFTWQTCSIYLIQFYLKTLALIVTNLISDHLKQMIYSKTKEGFDSGYKVALDIIQNRDQQHDKYEMSLHKFAENKDTYAL